VGYGTVIDRLLDDRTKLEAAQPAAKEVAKVATMLPNAAEVYRQQIELRLDGDARAALKARVTLRKLCGTILLEPGEEEGSLWARFELRPAALLMTARSNSGRGDRI
jgi:hypothetical protein